MEISYSKRIWKLQNFIPKHPFFFTLETVLKMIYVQSKVYAQEWLNMHQKRWRKLKPIWIDYEQLITDCFDCIFYIHKQFSLFDTNTNVLTGFMISVFLAATAPRVRSAWNLTGTSVRNELRFFLLFGKKCYFIEMLNFLINKLFRNVFQTSRVIGLTTILHAKLQYLKSI